MLNILCVSSHSINKTLRLGIYPHFAGKKVGLASLSLCLAQSHTVSKWHSEEYKIPKPKRLTDVAQPVAYRLNDLV